MPARDDDSKRFKSLPARGAIAIAVTVLTVALVIGAAVQAWRSEARRSEVEREALAALSALDSFLSVLKDAETGERGFLLTQDPRYLEPFLDSEPRAALELSRLRAFSGDSADPRAQVDALASLMSARLEDLKATIALERAGRHGEAIEVVRGGEGKRVMDEIRARAARIRADLLVRRDRDAAQAREATRRWLWITLGGGALLLALTALAGRQALRGVRTLARDDRERQHMVEFQQRLIGIIGHDIRNPLSAILATALFLRKHGGLDEAQSRAVDRIGRGGERIERIANMLLDYTHARLGHGIPVSPTVANVHEVGAAVLEEFRAVQPSRQVEAVFEGNGVGYWDPGRLAQVLSNLVGNALKYGSREAPVRVSVRDAEDAVRIEVHNRGAPIPGDVLPYIFEPFRRGVEAGARGTDKENLGLGLYIVREIVAAHGGTIRARSSEPEGTTFTVELPRNPPVPPAPEPLPREKAASSQRPGSLRRSARLVRLVELR